MGAAPEILQEAELTPQEARESDQEWFLDAESGELRPEENPDGEPEDLPRPIRVARWIFD
ncbi:hypothetical protein [Streptacidiphilus jiangxiensis]|uniref:Uncharacterized protein n=1 Tax=Streptacidiphilus jiangxiensis TaxID=235985 RepID=A0A1H7QTR8_STRJI|nr:hypothetical protein [Streptacidiphilus jiangxiensis]SEL51322.1 hypothetical protein SAMN05414137_109209 [Streptacidiphilus jiangxiensis]